MKKVTVLGCGGWGMALALTAYKNGNKVTLWSAFSEEADALRQNRTNERLLKDIFIPDGILITDDLSVVEGDDLTIIAVPSIAVREVAHKLSAYKNFGTVVNVSKGIENKTLKRLSQVIGEELPEAPIVVLSGPSHAEEVARDIPTSLVAVGSTASAAEMVQEIMTNENLRIYTSSDLIGVELGGALKNVIAVAAGFCDGLGLGDNSKAALITRGLAEMSRLGVTMGAKEYTFAGLTGIGDLIVTCTSRHSRNNRFGFKVGTGTPVAEALNEVGTVEGYYAAKMAHELAKKHSIELPIIEECYSVLYKNKDVRDVVPDLMTRPKRNEH